MSWLLLVGRILFGGFFLISGINHFTKLEQMAGYAAGRGVPSAELMVALSGLLLVLGGLSVLLGFAPRIGLGLLVLFLVPVTLVMHPFWSFTDSAQRMAEMTNFLKNLALTGAALQAMAVRVPWPLSLDQPLRRRWPAWDRWMGPHAPAGT